MSKPLSDYLPKEVPPIVQVSREPYGTSDKLEIKVKRIFNILPDCEYTEYYFSYDEVEYRLVDADITVGSQVPSYRILRKYYPDIVDISELYNFNKITKPITLFESELYRPLVLNENVVEGDSNSILQKLSDVKNIVVSGEDFDGDLSGLVEVLARNTVKTEVRNTVKEVYEALHSDIYKLSEDIKSLKEENAVLKQQVKDLVNGQVPKDISNNILTDIFEGENG